MSPQNILVADDDPLILEHLGNGLRQAGYRVLSAADGVEAVTLGNAQRPDLAVLDIRMPGMSGIDAARLLKESAGVFSLFLSACTDKEMVDSATREGALGYLVKPIDTHQLIPAIEAALQRAAELRKLQANQASLTEAIYRSREISQAVGIYMARHKVNSEQAFGALRDYARQRQLKLLELARQVIAAAGDGSDIIQQIHQNTKKGRQTPTPD